MDNSFRVLSLYLTIYLMFNAGFIYEVDKDAPVSISLNNTIDYPRFNEQEFLGAKWIFDSKNSRPVYADKHRLLILGSFEWFHIRYLPVNINEILHGSYIYFGSYNIKFKKGFLFDVEKNLMIEKNIDPSYIIDCQNKIYDNGGMILGQKK